MLYRVRLRKLRSLTLLLAGIVLAGCAVTNHVQDVPALTDEVLACGHCGVYIFKGAPAIDPQLMFAVCKAPSKLNLDILTGMVSETGCQVLWPPITANQASSFQLGTIGNLFGQVSFPLTPVP